MAVRVAYEGMGNMCWQTMLVWWPTVDCRYKAVQMALIQAPMKPAQATNEQHRL